MSLNDIKTLFRKSNRVVSILQLINLILNTFLLISTAIIAYAFATGLLQSNPLISKEEVSLVTDTVLTKSFLFNLLVNLVFNIAIMSLAFRNQSRLNQNKELSEMPYLLGYTLIAINIIADIMLIGFNINIILQFFYLPFYINSRRTARFLNKLS